MNTVVLPIGRSSEMENLTGPKAFPLREKAAFESNNFTSPRTILREPIELSGEKVLIKPELMVLDRAYSFKFLGVSVAAIKRSDESIDFYELPKP